MDENKISKTCSMHVEEERFVQNFDRKNSQQSAGALHWSTEKQQQTAMALTEWRVHAGHRHSSKRDVTRRDTLITDHNLNITLKYRVKFELYFPSFAYIKVDPIGSNACADTACIFIPKNEGSRFLQNSGIRLQVQTTLQPGRSTSTPLQARKPQICSTCQWVSQSGSLSV